MKTISEEKFKIVLNTMWIAYANSRYIIDIMENIGLNVEPSETGAYEPGFGKLYEIQDKTGSTILQVLGITDNTPGFSCDGRTILDDLDDLMNKIYMESQESQNGMAKEFPTRFYPALISCITRKGTISTDME